ncbi:MAG TPA: TPM domain-containing protein [Pyrinomonadaceae bacterium]
MTVEVLRLRAAAGACLCCALLLLAACARSSSAPAGGETVARSQSLVTRPTPAQNTQPTPARSPVGESPLSPPVGYVKDDANVIDARAEGLLEEKLKQLKERAKIEMAVATVETTGEQDIYDYSLAVARGWGIGPPAGEEGGGVLLLLAVKDRKWRIQVTRSLEADIPNDAAADIGRLMGPSLRAGRYGEAVTKCVDGLIQRLAERRGFSMKASELNVKTKNANRKP